MVCFLINCKSISLRPELKRNMNKRIVIIFGLLLISITSFYAQRYNLGVRAGLSYSKIQGPSEEGMLEGSNFNDGIHFGITFSYKINEYFGFKTELGYTAVGSKDSIVGDSYFIFGIGSQNIVKEGYAKRYLDVSNSYINIPLNVYVYPFKKLELFGGPYVGFLINPTAGGRLAFDDGSDELKYSFIQTLDHNYYQDNARDLNSNKGFSQVITVLVDGSEIIMPRVVGAYYQFVEKNGNLYKWFDFGLTAGAHYYVNKSFYAGVRVDYGLFDVTRTNMDVSYRQLDGEQYILRDDRDTNLSLQFSLGFKF